MSRAGYHPTPLLSVVSECCGRRRSGVWPADSCACHRAKPCMPQPVRPYAAKSAQCSGMPWIMRGAIPAQHISKMQAKRLTNPTICAQALELAGELAAWRTAAVPVSLAASKWPGGNAADHGSGAAGGGGGEGSGAVAQQQNSSDAAAPARQELPNGSAQKAQTGQQFGLPGVMSRLLLWYMPAHVCCEQST